MCLLCESSSKHDSGISRRSVLAGIGGLAALGGLAACTSASEQATAATSAAATATQAPEFNTKLEVVLLGTQAGPPIVPDRTGISTALVVDGHVYLVDCGRGASTQYVRAGLPLKSLKAIFLTHLHADHLADYYNFFLLGGYVPQPSSDNIAPPIQVYGPGPAGGLPPKFGGGEAPVISPDNPTPGTVELTAGCISAYAYSSNVFLRDSNIPAINTLMEAHNIQVPDVGASYTNTAPVMRPFPVMEDDRVKVTGILVPHGPVYPAFAFRFDTAYGSVTFSGDTTYTDNIPTLADNTDLLIHEAINIQGGKISEAFAHHLTISHVEVQKLGPIAERSGAKKLVLSHIGDLAKVNPYREIDTTQWTEWAQQGYKGPVSVGKDLQRIKLA